MLRRPGLLQLGGLRFLTIAQLAMIQFGDGGFACLRMRHMVRRLIASRMRRALHWAVIIGASNQIAGVPRPLLRSFSLLRLVCLDTFFVRILLGVDLRAYRADLP